MKELCNRYGKPTPYEMMGEEHDQRHDHPNDKDA